MGADDIVFHIIIEVLAILVSIYLLWLAPRLKQKNVHKWLLGTIGVGNIIIDVYAIVTWFIHGFMSKMLFHQVTEALASPAGIYLIWLGIKQEHWWNKATLVALGVGNVLVDGYLLFFTW